MSHEIVLDCPPGCTRPDDVLKRVLNDTGLSIDDFTIVSKFFGAWTFVLNENKNALYETKKDVIVGGIKKMYEGGIIRYAEW
jgi:hypothetical protein